MVPNTRGFRIAAKIQQPHQPGEAVPNIVVRLYIYNYFQMNDCLVKMDAFNLEITLSLANP